MRPSAGKAVQIISMAAISSALGNHFRWFHIGSSATAAAWQQFAAAAVGCTSQRQHPAHKNADFVLETPENEGFEGQKRTKTSILCSGGRGSAPGREEFGIGKRNRRDAYRKRCIPANHRARFKNANTS